MNIKQLDEFCKLRNRSIVVHKGKLRGFRPFDYVLLWGGINGKV